MRLVNRHFRQNYPSSSSSLDPEFGKYKHNFPETKMFFLAVNFLPACLLHIIPELSCVVLILQGLFASVYTQPGLAITTTTFFSQVFAASKIFPLLNFLDI